MNALATASRADAATQTDRTTTPTVELSPIEPPAAVAASPTASTGSLNPAAPVVEPAESKRSRIAFFELAALIVLAPFTFPLTVPWGLLPLQGFRVSLADLLLPLLAIGLVIRRLVLKQPIKLPAKLLVFVGVYYLASLVSIAWGLFAHPDFNLGFAVMPLARLALVGLYAVFCFVLAQHLSTLQIHRLFAIWTVVAVAQSLDALLFLVGIRSGLPTTSPTRWVGRYLGFLGDPNFFATYMLLSIIVSGLAYAYFRNRLYLIAMLPLFGAIIASASRSGLIGLIAVLVFCAVTVFVKNPPLRRPLGIILGGLVTLALVAVPYLSTTSQVVSRLVGSFARIPRDPRFDLWSVAVDLWRRSPVFGIGAGQFRVANPIVSRTGFGQLAHNVYLSNLAELGLIGFVIVVFGAIALLRYARGTRGLGELSRMLLICAAIVVVVQMASLNLENMRFVWLFIGFIILLHQYYARSTDDGSAVTETDENAPGLRDFQLQSLEVLTAFDAFCAKHQLRYYIAAGTLLGAIRHAGFIPWDDDIDVKMPRPDYDRLNELIDAELQPPLKALRYGRDPEYTRYFTRIIDTSNSARYATGEDRHPSVDVLPIDGVPASRIGQYCYFRYLRFLKGMYRLALIDSIDPGLPRPASERIVISIVRTLHLSRFINPDRYYQRIDQLFRRYSFDDSAYVACGIGRYKDREIMARETYGPGSEYLFEGRSFTGPSDSDKYLRNLYDDYWTPAGRKGHGFVSAVQHLDGIAVAD